MLRKPSSLVEGQAFVGTSFEKHFASSPGATGEWYKGTISEVKDKLRGTAEESRKLLKGLFFDIRSGCCSPVVGSRCRERSEPSFASLNKALLYFSIKMGALILAFGRTVLRVLCSIQPESGKSTRRAGMVHRSDG